MGTWSGCIMGGDTQLDIECNLFDGLLGVDNLDLPDNIKDIMNYNMDKIVLFTRESSYPILAPQVVAYLVMKHGAEMPDELRGLARESVSQEKHSGFEGWRDLGKERIAYLKDFVNTVGSYPKYGGEPVVLRDVGLFEVFASATGNAHASKVGR